MRRQSARVTQRREREGVRDELLDHRIDVGQVSPLPADDRLGAFFASQQVGRPLAREIHHERVATVIDLAWSPAAGVCLEAPRHAQAHAAGR